MDRSTRKILATALAALDTAIERLRGRCDTLGLTMILTPLRERVDTCERYIREIREEAKKLDKLWEEK